MKNLSIRTRTKIILFLLSYVYIAHMHAVASQMFPFIGFTYIAYSTLILFWIRSIERRITQHAMRRCLIAGASFLLAMFVNTLMWTQYFAGFLPFGRWLWYADFVPLILGALVTFMAATCVDKDEEWRLSPAVRLLIIPGVLLSVLLCTNDLHGWAYTFHSSSFLEDYDRGWLYYLAIVWMIVLILAAYTIVTRHCVLSSARKLSWVPFLPLLAELFYFIFELYLRRQILNRELLQFGYQEMFGFMFIGFWEGCIQIGLVPSNSDYEALFDGSSIAAFLANEKGVVVRRSAAAGSFSARQLEAARHKALLVDENTRLSAFPITGGTAYWTTDLTRENRILKSLRDTKEQLAEEQTLLAAENKIAEDRARILAQSRLYDEIADGVEERLYRLESLLSEPKGNPEEYRRNLQLRLFTGAYIKRRANLCILAEKDEQMPVEELRLSIKESMDALTLMDIACDVRVRQQGVSSRIVETTVPSTSVAQAFDVYQEVCEKTMQQLTALLVTIVPGGKEDTDILSLRLSLEAACSPEELLRSLGDLVMDGDLEPVPQVNCTVEDETLYLTAVFAPLPENAVAREDVPGADNHVDVQGREAYV